MNINLVVWATTAIILEGSNALETFAKFQLVSSGKYKVFVPTKKFYSIMTTNHCKKFKGDYIHILKTSDWIQNFTNTTIRGLLNVDNLQFVCQLHGTVDLENEFVRALAEPCKFRRRYCYGVNKTLIFWDNVYSTLVLFNGQLDLWEMELPGTSKKLNIFAHRTLNFTLILKKKVMMPYVNLQNETFFSTLVNNVIVEVLPVGDTDDYFNRNISEIYFGKIANRTKYKEQRIKIELISSGRYELFYLTKPVYYALNDTGDCVYKIFNSPPSVPVLNNLPGKINKHIKKFKYVCKAPSRQILLDKNIILLPERPCQFSRGFCYINASLAFWDNTSSFRTELFFTGKLNLWKIEDAENNSKLTAIINPETDDYLIKKKVVIVNNTTVWITNLDSVYIRERPADTDKRVIKAVSNYNSLILYVLFTLVLVYVTMNCTALLVVVCRRDVLLT